MYYKGIQLHTSAE
uniref:Uncharacterized protein n=1 Tax=Anguilla anguilla TaxID=7936 RepID=A0A0E9SY64_ANGAN